jgi:hypothetical protein
MNEADYSPFPITSRHNILIVLFRFGVVNCSHLELRYVAFAWSPDGFTRPLRRLLTWFLNCACQTDQKWAIKSHLSRHLATYWSHLSYFKFWVLFHRITRSVHVYRLNEVDCIVRISASFLLFSDGFIKRQEGKVVSRCRAYCKYTVLSMVLEPSTQQRNRLVMVLIKSIKIRVHTMYRSVLFVLLHYMFRSMDLHHV